MTKKGYKSPYKNMSYGERFGVKIAREVKNLFKSYGFDTLVIWERELKNKEKVIEKIEEFEKI